MGRLEDGLVEAMEALCADEPDCGRHMMVLPVGSLTHTEHLTWGLRVARAGEVAMLCRDEAPE